MKQFKLVCLFVVITLFIKLDAFKIDIPGEYKLENTFSETETILQIAVSNVIIDLAGHRIANGEVGIEIDAGLSNISIKNGLIDTCAVGISVKENCSFIRLKDIEIINCANRAIQLIGTSGNEINGVIMRRLKIHQCSTSNAADHLVSIDYADDVIMESSLIVKSGNSGMDIRGISLTNSSNAVFDRVRISTNEGLTFFGFYMEAAADSCLHMCDVRSNTAANKFTGFCFTGGSATKGNVATKCCALNNVSNNGPMSGFELLADVTQNIMKECCSMGNQAMNGVATADCFGFNVDQASFCSMQKCRALYNNASANGASNMCAGFNIGTSAGGSTGTKNCEFVKNQAIGNNGFDDDHSYGLRSESNDPDGNKDNIFFSNKGVRNGPNNPKKNNQITSNSGGVPVGSVKSDDIKGLNGKSEKFSNARIV